MLLWDKPVILDDEKINIIKKFVFYKFQLFFALVVRPVNAQ
jgi:hypothetical protein